MFVDIEKEEQMEKLFESSLEEGAITLDEVSFLLKYKYKYENNIKSKEITINKFKNKL